MKLFGVLLFLAGALTIGIALFVGFTLRPDSNGQLELVLAGCLGAVAFLSALLIITEADEH